MKVSGFAPICIGLSMIGTLASHAQAGGPDPAAAAPLGQAQSGQDTTPAKKVEVHESVTVTAPGEDRNVQTVGHDLLQEAPAGTSPIAVLAHLPSVEVTKSDPYGAYEWALRINVRGFSQNQLGFTLDDVPLGDMSYGNLNGLHISRAIIDEDLGRVVVSPGTGSLAVASNSNLGATVQFYSADPAEKRHFDIQQTFGSYNGYRTFGRFDSGSLGRHGTRFYVAGVYQRADKFKGGGDINQHYFQFNGKLTQPLGGKGLFTYYVDYSNRAEVDYQDLNKVWVNTLGYKVDNFGDWNTSLQAANAYNAQGKTGYPVFSTIPTVFPGTIPLLQKSYGDLSNDPEDVGYYGASGLRKDFLTYASVKYALTSHLNFAVTAYGHRNDGRGLWFTPYLPSFDQIGTPVSPISLRTSEYGISRGGFVTSLTWETGKNMLEGGVWYEKEKFDLARRYYGTTLASPSHSLYDFPKNPFYTQWAYTFPEFVLQAHLQDTFRITRKFSASAGVKGITTHITGNLTGFNQGLNLAPTTTAASYAQGELSSGKNLLPQFGVDWKLNNASELFADVARNARAFQAGGNGFGTSPWGTTQAGFNALTSSLQPETSWTEEGGYRYTGKAVQAQASFFHINFANRLLAIQQGAAIAGNASILSNVGGVTTNGVDGGANIPIKGGWSLYNAITFSKTTYDSNYLANGVVIPTGGKVTVDSPRVLYKNELAYRRGGFESHVASDIMGKRYFTYTDDNSVPGRATVDFGTSYHRDEVGIFDQVKIQFNVFNLANNKFYETIGTNGFVASDPTSVNNNTLQVGFPRAFTGTLTARF
jgi:iron complex outermembrane receptor protein